MKLASSVLLSLVIPVVLSCSVDDGSPMIKRTIDPNLPREDPASYPDYPIVSVPQESVGEAGVSGDAHADADLPDESNGDAPE